MRRSTRSPFALLLVLLVPTVAPLLSAQEAGRAPSDDPRARFLTSRESKVALPLPLEDDAFLFAVFGDRTGGPAAGVQVLAQAVADVNVLDPDLVMTVGDLVEGYNDTPEWLVQMREFKSIMGGLARPWFPVVGNHDLYWRGKGTAPEREHEANYETHFGPLWYAFEHKGCWFLCLHSDEDDPEKGDKTFNDPRGQRMSAEQFAWLDRTLQQAAGARHVFLFLHHPRWLGGNYGDDWQRVHRRLVDARNVTAVFAGHIHHMRYDGVRDGIEYFALATVGGSQQGIAPSAGWLHEYHLVMVRDGGIEVATLPVGTVIDPREVTGAISEEVRALAAALPRRVDGAARFAADRSWAELAIELKNPTTRPVEVTVAPRSADSRWRFFPDHDHATLAPGEQRRVVVRTRHASALPDDDVRAPELDLQVAYLGEARRFPLPERTLPIAIDPASLPRAAPRGAVDPASGLPLEEKALSLDGKSGRVRVESDRLALPDGPFTVEGWFAARQHGPRVGLLCKTENSEFGLFAHDGRPEFLVHLAGAYVTAKSSIELPLEGWHHLAGVFDGEQVRLYLDGALVGHAAGRGARTRNDLPLLIGADVKQDSSAESFFAGRVDAVRISTGARYSGERFEPARELPIDATTLLALDMESCFATWLLDGSPRALAAERVGGTQVEAR